MEPPSPLANRCGRGLPGCGHAGQASGHPARLGLLRRPGPAAPGRYLGPRAASLERAGRRHHRPGAGAGACRRPGRRHPVGPGRWSRGLRRHHAVWSRAGDRHPARARGTFGPGSVADRQCGSVGSARLAVRLDNVSRLVGDGKLAALVGRGPRDGLPAGRAQLVREPPPGCRLDPRGELAGRPSRPLLAALLSLADPGHRPGRGHGTDRLPGRRDRSFEAEGRSVATKSAEGRRIIGRGLDSDDGHRSDPGDPGSKLPLGSPARADGSLQGRRPVGRAPGPGPRARQTLERLA